MTLFGTEIQTFHLVYSDYNFFFIAHTLILYYQKLREKKYLEIESFVFKI